jgi:hypothetical protein
MNRVSLRLGAVKTFMRTYMKKQGNTKADQGKRGRKDGNCRFSMSRSLPSDPPNPFLALWCSTSDPAMMELLPLACGTRSRSDSPRRVHKTRTVPLSFSRVPRRSRNVRSEGSSPGPDRKSCIPDHFPDAKMRVICRGVSATWGR